MLSDGTRDVIHDAFVTLETGATLSLRHHDVMVISWDVRCGMNRYARSETSLIFNLIETSNTKQLLQNKHELRFLGVK